MFFSFSMRSYASALQTTTENNLTFCRCGVSGVVCKIVLYFRLSSFHLFRQQILFVEEQYHGDWPKPPATNKILFVKRATQTSETVRTWKIILHEMWGKTTLPPPPLPHNSSKTRKLHDSLTTLCSTRSPLVHRPNTSQSSVVSYCLNAALQKTSQHPANENHWMKCVHAPVIPNAFEQF